MAALVAADAQCLGPHLRTHQRVRNGHACQHALDDSERSAERERGRGAGALHALDVLKDRHELAAGREDASKEDVEASRVHPAFSVDLDGRHLKTRDLAAANDGDRTAHAGVNPDQ